MSKRNTSASLRPRFKLCAYEIGNVSPTNLLAFLATHESVLINRAGGADFEGAAEELFVDFEGGGGCFYTEETVADPFGAGNRAGF